MKARTLIGALALILASACAVEIEDLNRVDDSNSNDPAPQDAVCEVYNVSVKPTFAQGPVARTEPITVRFFGHADDATFSVAAAGHEVAGETLVDAQAAYFVPHYAWPRGAMVGWAVTLCGQTHMGQFEVGSILDRISPSTLATEYLEVPQPLDFATGDWVLPKAQRFRHQLLAETYGAAVLVEVERFGYEGLLLSVTPARHDDVGNYLPLPGSEPEHAILAAWNNPYAVTDIGTLVLQSAAGPVVLRGARVLLGFGPHGFVDTRLKGELDLGDARGVAPKTTACEQIERWTMAAGPEVALHAFDLTGDPAVDVGLRETTLLERAGACRRCELSNGDTCVDFEVTGLSRVAPLGYKLPQLDYGPPLNEGVNPEVPVPIDPYGPM